MVIDWPMLQEQSTERLMAFEEQGIENVRRELAAKRRALEEQERKKRKKRRRRRRS
jgi:hypothetical protein